MRCLHGREIERLRSPWVSVRLWPRLRAMSWRILSIPNIKGFTDAQHHEAWSSHSEQEDGDVADGAAAGSTMRRRHRLHRQACIDFRAVFHGHIWRHSLIGVGQHHVALGGDDDLPISAAALQAQSASRTRAQARSRRPPLCDFVSWDSLPVLKVALYMSFLGERTSRSSGVTVGLGAR